MSGPYGALPGWRERSPPSRSRRRCRCGCVRPVPASSAWTVDPLTLAYADEQRVTLFATDEWSERLEDLPEVIGEGPSYDAYEERLIHPATGRRGG